VQYRLTVLQPTLVKTPERTVDLRLRDLADTQYVSVSVERGGFATHRSTYDSTFLLQSLQDGAKEPQGTPTGRQHRPAALWSTAPVNTGGDVLERGPRA
jgi:hypothetical protein